MASFLLVVYVQILLFQHAFGIVNLEQQTADPIFRSHMRTDRDPSATRFAIECLNEVSQFYFIKRERITRSNSLVLTSAKTMSSPAALIQEGFLKLLHDAVTLGNTEKLFQIRLISDSQLLNSSTKIPKHSHLVLADFYAIVVDSVERLKKLMRLCAESMDSWNPGARFLVLYNNVEERECQKLKKRASNLFEIADQDEFQVQYKNESEQKKEKDCRSQNQTETIMEIYTEMLKKFYVHRIAVLYANDDFNYTLSSMDYFSKKSCRTIIETTIGFCNQGKIYPSRPVVNAKMRKVQNHQNSANCTFNVCASIAEPFVEKDCRSGLELRLMEFMKNRLKLNIKTQCTPESRGVQQQQENWTGLLGKLKLGDCDFIIGGYYPDNDVASAFWTSHCYFDDSHTWFIKLAEERPAWMALYSIFDEKTWNCFLLMMPITWLFWYFLVKFLPEPKGDKEFSLIGINNLGVSICVAVNERPLCHATRIFWLALAVYGLNIASLYTSRLIAVFANPGYLHQIDNLQEVIEAGIPFGGPEETADWFENEEDMWIYKRFNTSAQFEPNSENLEAVKNGKRVILSNRLFIIQHNVSDEVFGFAENVFASPVQMIMKPGFPFMFEINRLISYMNDAGIFNILLNRFYFNNTYLRRIAKLRPQFQETVIVITTDHLQGPFLLLIFGIICSSLICLIEIWVHRCSVKQQKQKSLKKKKKKKETQGKGKRKHKAYKKQTNTTRKKITSGRTPYHIRSNKYADHSKRFTPHLNRTITHHNRTLLFQIEFPQIHKKNFPQEHPINDVPLKRK